VFELFEVYVTITDEMSVGFWQVVDFRHREIRYYDSMGSNNEKCLNALV